MADSKPKKEVKLATDDPETTIEDATPLADPSKGEISPAADQSNRGAEIAARMAVTTPKTKPQDWKKKSESETLALKRAGGKIINEDGEEEFVDIDELEEAEEHEEFPKTICVNCRNHGRGEQKLNDKGFCKKCGFKLNRVHNMALEPARK